MTVINTAKMYTIYIYLKIFRINHNFGASRTFVLEKKVVWMIKSIYKNRQNAGNTICITVLQYCGYMLRRQKKFITIHNNHIVYAFI
jgi:hypothetical protein